MIELVLPADDVDSVRAELLGGAVERCAILFAMPTHRSDGLLRLLTREVMFATSSDYLRQGPIDAQLAPEFVARATKRARREGLSLVFVHSHPGTDHPTFSPVDDDGETHLAAFLARRHPGPTHLALVISAGGVRARRLGTNEDVQVASIGPKREVLFHAARTNEQTSEVFDRQVRAFGSAGQQTLQGLRIGIVGLGGTGSLIVQQLAHLGVRDFILIDPDTLEPTNLNRVANAAPTDVHRPKVEMAARYINTLAPDAKAVCTNGDVIRARIARELINCDMIFGCTDSHGSRAVLQQVAYQYLIPCIDMGTTIAAAEGRVTHIYGRVQLLAPGLACFTCGGLLDSNEVRRDMMSAFERQADPYFLGAHEPAPSVMSLNSTVASLAITMFLAVVAGIPSDARHLLYNAIASNLRAVRAEPSPNCHCCSRSGGLARGDGWPLSARQD
jgi:molybdopterin/thiamine biosynthesis adenylyltransferase